MDSAAKMEDLRYPIGKFSAQQAYTQQEVKERIARIASLPEKMQKAVQDLTDAQLDTPYREGGWTVRQVVHHVTDSHSNAYIRVKWTLTEETPLIKAYEEKKWAVTPETKEAPALSLALLKALHAKLVVLMKAIPFEQLNRQYIHPETQKHVRLDSMIDSYAWHGDHHLAHIEHLKKRMGW